jgi:hypothetical protein
VIGPRRVKEVGRKSRFFGWGRVTDWLIVTIAQPEDPGTPVSEILLLGADGLNVGPGAPAVAMNLVDIGLVEIALAWTWTRGPLGNQDEIHREGLMVPELDEPLQGKMVDGAYRNLLLARRYARDRVRAVNGGLR